MLVDIYVTHSYPISIRVTGHTVCSQMFDYVDPTCLDAPLQSATGRPSGLPVSWPTFILAYLSRTPPPKYHTGRRRQALSVIASGTEK